MSANVTAGEFNGAVGIGPHYGGVLGGQLSFVEEDVKYYFALGLVGFSSGFQVLLDGSANHSLGLNLGADFIWGDEGYLYATYDYHLNGFYKDGLVLGLGVGNAFGSKGEDEFSSDLKNQNIVVSFNIGYKF